MTAKMRISSGGGSYQDPAAGTFPAVCVRVIDIGTQEQENNGEKVLRRQIILQFELHGESVDSDASGFMLGENGQPDPFKPFLVSAWVTASFNEKANLRKYMENWRGAPYTEEQIAEFESEGFDWNLMLGVPCMVKMGLNKNNKMSVRDISKLQKNVQPPRPVSPTYAFVLDDFNPDVFDKIPDGIKEFIRKSPQWKALNGGTADAPVLEAKEPSADAPFDDEIPF